MKALKIPRIDALDLRDPVAVARADRIREDGGFDWDFPVSPPQEPTFVEMFAVTVAASLDEIFALVGGKPPRDTLWRLLREMRKQIEGDPSVFDPFRIPIPEH